MVASPHSYSFLLFLVCRRVLRLLAQVQQVAPIQLARDAPMAAELTAPAREVVKARGTASAPLG